MTLPSKGSRLITVDGTTYRWRVRHRPTYSQGLTHTPLTFAVEQAEPAGATLWVTTPQAHPSNWMGAPAVAVRPADVEAAIRTAVAAGWEPTTPGPTFRLDLEGDGR